MIFMVTEVLEVTIFILPHAGFRMAQVFTVIICRI